MSQWKATERAIAEYLGGKRIPITGRQRGDVPDVDHPHFAIEVKLRRKLPAWLYDAVAQAVAAAEKAARLMKIKLPIVVLHESGKRHDDDLVVMRLRDFRDWFGD